MRPLNEWLMIAYEWATVALPFLILYTVFSRRQHRFGDKNTISHFFTLLIFVFYVFGVLYITGAGTLYDALRLGLDGELNLMPFAGSTFTMGYILNVFLFLPLGFLLPLVWPKTNRFWCILAFGLAFTLLIEASQLLNFRSTDIDDIMMNTLGAVLGFLLYRLAARLFGWKPKRLHYTSWEPVIYIIGMFLGRFFLFNEMGLARILYKF